MPPEDRTQQPRVPTLVDRLRPDRLRADRPDRGVSRNRPGTEFDSADPDELVRRLDASDCFCRDTKVGRMYHPREVSFRELTPRDSLHVTFGEDRTVSTHIDRRSPLARRQPGGFCRYSPLRIVAHNITGALNDVLRLTIGRRTSTADYLVDHLVDDHAVSHTVAGKENGRLDGDEPDFYRAGAERRDDTGELQAVSSPSRP